jgi:hypothetical protein
MFLDKLKTSIGIYEVRVHAYVLMSNHFHMIVETRKEIFPNSCGILTSAIEADNTKGSDLLLEVGLPVIFRKKQ